MEARCYQALPLQVSTWRLGDDRGIPGPGAGCRFQDCCLGAELQQVTLPRFLHLSDDSTTYLVELTQVKTQDSAWYPGNTPCMFNKKRNRETVSKGERVRWDFECSSSVPIRCCFSSSITKHCSWLLRVLIDTSPESFSVAFLLSVSWWHSPASWLGMCETFSYLALGTWVKGCLLFSFASVVVRDSLPTCEVLCFKVIPGSSCRFPSRTSVNPQKSFCLEGLRDGLHLEPRTGKKFGCPCSLCHGWGPCLEETMPHLTGTDSVTNHCGSLFQFWL